MTENEIKELVLKHLKKIAPEIDTDTMEPGTRFRNQFDFDSVDFLNFITSLQKEANLVIPENDAPNLSSLEGAVNYLKKRI
jgi:acyl carrier protein